ncbi:Lrp/AsnC family transcriptional regulator [Bradyrhizobium manausense]
MKRMRYVDGEFDNLDAAIPEQLAAEARMPLKELAPQHRARVNVFELEEAGVIEHYSIRMNAKAAGLSVTAHIRARPFPGTHGDVARLLDNHRSQHFPY